MSPHDQDLRTTLHRLADASEPLPVDDDLWGRARAAQRRSRVVLAAAVVAVVVAVGGGVALWPTGDREARTAAQEVPGGAIPSRIEDPGDLESESNLSLGRASAAFISESSEPVVITAADGLPHQLGLAGWVANGSDPDEIQVNQSLALSPDGRRLAWQAADDQDGRATVGVLDLASGETSTFHPLPPRAGLRLREMSWSPDSAWLVFIADDSPEVWVGRLRPGSDHDNRANQLVGNVASVAVDPSGTIVLSRASGALERIHPAGDIATIASRTDLDELAVGAGLFSPDGRYLAMRSSLGPASFTFDTKKRVLRDHPFPDGTFSDAFVLPQGWVDDRLQLLLVQTVSDREVAELVVTTPSVDATSTWRRSVGQVNGSIAGTLSLAVDLVPDLDGTSSQELTHDFGDTSGSTRTFLGVELSLAIGLGVAAAIALLMALRWLWRRLLG
ncbi:hypothetical protein [Nocardioides zeicaulis]|uniref:WD40 repeat domain-containing protein n=1 Tax=Nocardioides zeicaulis TaxID=1776857 RepID=A0ABV6E2F5_9ACTN